MPQSGQRGRGELVDGSGRTSSGMGRFRLRYSIQEFDLSEGETTLGRSEDCRITLDEVSVSRVHASVHVSAAQASIRDLGSRNGTLVNGLRLQGTATELHDGDRLQIGTVQLIFCDSAERRTQRRTGQWRDCTRCGAPCLLEAPVCHRCGCRAHGEPKELDGRTPLASNERQVWFLDLQCDLLERAVSMGRMAETEALLRRVMDVVDAHVSGDGPCSIASTERALELCTRLAAVRGETSSLRWVLDVLRRLRRAPSAGLLTQLLATPPILLVEIEAPVKELAAWLEAHGHPGHELERLVAATTA